VKYGKGGRFRVDREKMRRIEMAANSFLKKFGDFEELRLDVVEVSEDGIVHIEGVGD
jgi:putative endonuclease